MSLNFSAHSRHLSKLTIPRPLHSSQRVITDRPHTEATDSRVRVRYGQVRGCGSVDGGRRGVGEVEEGMRGLMAGPSTHLPSMSRSPLPFGSEVKRKQKLQRKSEFKGKDFEH